MRTATFWAAITFSFFIALESISIISGCSNESGETHQEGFVGFETTEINVPVQHFDFTDEEPMVITAGSGTVK